MVKRAVCLALVVMLMVLPAISEGREEEEAKNLSTGRHIGVGLGASSGIAGLWLIFTPIEVSARLWLSDALGLEGGYYPPLFSVPGLLDFTVFSMFAIYKIVDGLTADLYTLGGGTLRWWRDPWGEKSDVFWSLGGGSS